jgi:hypothetical protein
MRLRRLLLASSVMLALSAGSALAQEAVPVASVIA